MMKKIISVILAAVMLVLFCACGSTSNNNNNSNDTGSGDNSGVIKAESNDSLRFVTGGESGTYYAFGSVIAQHATNNIGINVTGIVGNGSKANVEALQAFDAELAFCQSDVMAYAYTGTNLFEEPIDCFNTVAALYTEQVQIVTLNKDIKTVADLEGKKVSVGAAGSGVYFNAVDILSAYGIGDRDAEGKFTKIDATYQSFGDSADALKDGKIDAAFIVAGAPTTAVTDLSTTKDVYLVSLDKEHIASLIEKSPYYTECVIAKDVYNTEEDIETVGVGAVILVREDVSDDAVYKLTKDIFDNYEDLVDSHAKYGELSFEYATSITSVPYHAGAAKYFEEKGFTVSSVAK